MVARGRVKNGVIVLDNSVRLPEGQEVTVLGARYRAHQPTNGRLAAAQRPGHSDCQCWCGVSPADFR